MFQRSVNRSGRATRGAAQVVGQPGQTKAAIEQGWNGLLWGTSLDEFQAKFPDAHRNNMWWVTGTGLESFCGIAMDAQYAFNDRGELYLVAFYPKPEDRPRVSVAVVNHLGAPDGMDTRWTIGDILVEVKMAGILATITNTRFATRG